jgi:hypothetical protein
MVSQGITTSPLEPVYIGSGSEALVELEMAAWEQGYHAVKEPCLETMEEIQRAARVACDDALDRYIPLDEARFCDIYILAWSAGYCLHARKLKQTPPPAS